MSDRTPLDRRRIPAGIGGGEGALGFHQPRVEQGVVDAAAGSLLRYRIMAFVTGIVLLSGTVELIVKYAANVNPPGYGALWVAHGWLFVVYVIITAMLGIRLRWPLARYAVVMLAGTIPTMSFVAEHVVTGATRSAASSGKASAQPTSVRD